MGLFGNLFGGGKDTVTDPSTELPEGFGQVDFSVDRSRMFDLDRTRRLAQIVAAAPERWDDDSLAALYEALWNASISLPSDDAFVGPDGFPYLRLDIPAPGSFDSNSLANLAGACVEAGCGAALFASPEADDASFVMPLGVLDSLLTFGDWRGDPVDLAEQSDDPDVAVTIPQGTTIVTAAPSTDYLSSPAARALARHLENRWSIEDPRVALMVCNELQPTRSLVVGIARDRFANDAEADYFCRSVLWFLPPSRAIILMPEGWSQDDLFSLSELAAR